MKLTLPLQLIMPMKPGNSGLTWKKLKDGDVIALYANLGSGKHSL